MLDDCIIFQITNSTRYFVLCRTEYLGRQIRGRTPTRSMAGQQSLGLIRTEDPTKHFELVPLTNLCTHYLNWFINSYFDQVQFHSKFGMRHSAPESEAMHKCYRAL